VARVSGHRWGSPGRPCSSERSARGRREARGVAIQIPQGDSWKEVARGTTIGADKEIEVAPVRARRVRLNVFRAKCPVNINEFQVFGPPNGAGP
jgi:hypothetical protein